VTKKKKKQRKKSTALSKTQGIPVVFVYSPPPTGVGCSERFWWRGNGG